MKQLLSLILLLPMLCVAQPDWIADSKLPSRDELATINDSILQEGLRLYTYEKLSWMASDLLAEHATVDLSSIRGSAVQLDDNGKLTHFYCRQDSVVFSCTIDLNDFTLSWDNTVRPMTEDDRDAVHFRSEMINRIIETYGDSIYTIQDGSINIDLIWLGTDNLRAYLLQGTTLNGVIPFGNDYYVDIDRDGNLIEFHRFHHSYIPIDIRQAGENTQVLEVIHSHTVDNPFFTPTDICTALLYAHDLYGMKSVCILSTVFVPSAIMTFNMDDMSITVNEWEPH
ncbi:MAG: hypothetical protein IJG42_00990 [Muribaculaceae bacterium]|nr:hypothetical protein [Muribaculaceae bacterium]